MAMFVNREKAGELLGEKITKELEDKSGLVVLGIPRGGIITASAIAKILKCPLDVILVKKLSAPHQSELAIGAIGETEGSLYLNKGLIKDLNIGPDYIEKIKQLKYKEIKEKEKKYRQGRLALNLENKSIIIADDGAATGATVIAACREVWLSKPKKLIAALPVIAKDTLLLLEKEVDQVSYLKAPEIFYAVGQFYEEFKQVSDEEVIRLLVSI